MIVSSLEGSPWALYALTLPQDKSLEGEPLSARVAMSWWNKFEFKGDAFNQQD